MISQFKLIIWIQKVCALVWEDTGMSKPILSFFDPDFALYEISILFIGTIFNSYGIVPLDRYITMIYIR